MNVQTFLAHHGIGDNPFDAEEARHDPVFGRLPDTTTAHPDFPKILGRIDHPSTSVVFGEKGSGKTAIRLRIGNKIAEHNREQPDRRTLLVAYDDLNPILDRLMQRVRRDLGQARAARTTTEKLLESIRLEDHQDAVLSLATTKLVAAILNPPAKGSPTPTPPSGDAPMPPDLHKRIKKLPRAKRLDIAILAALYDQPRAGELVERWRRLRSKLRLGWRAPAQLTPALAGIGLFSTLVLLLMNYVSPPQGFNWYVPSAALAAAASIVLASLWGFRHTAVWSLARRIRQELLVVDRTTLELRQMLLELGKSDIANQPWPAAGTTPLGNQDARYQLTARLVAILEGIGYAGGLMILVDRVDEPTLVAGHHNRMKAIIWPMLDNKFLQQAGVGLKLLLPLELRHLLHRESAEFFQEARLDKQNMVDRLTWSGTMLYDVCTARLRACRSAPDDAEPIELTDLFDQSVTHQVLVEALDQMHQPRDAFKFLYTVIQDHCRSVPQDADAYRIPRLTLDNARRTQSQRLQELYRGLTPA